jgi:hypothetical protein
MAHGGTRNNPVAIYLYTNTRILSLYGAGADEEVTSDPHRRRHRSTEEPSSFEQALASHAHSRPQPRQRRPAPELHDTGRPGSSGRSVHSVPTLVVPVKFDAEPQRQARNTAGNPGAVALATLAKRLRQALERSRARRRERRRMESELSEDEDLRHKDFSPTGSVLPDEWQDTVQSAEDNETTATSSPQHHAGAASTMHDEHDLDMLATLEAEQALELAFMREDEIPPSAWRGAASSAGAAPPAAPGPSQDRRRRPLPATALVWPAPTLDGVEVQVVAPHSLYPGASAPSSQSPRLVSEAEDPVELSNQAASARAYEGVDRRRSYHA